MTNDQFPSAGESFPGMIDPIIARRARPRNFERRTSPFPRVFANRSSQFDDDSHDGLGKMSAHIKGFYGASSGESKLLWSNVKSLIVAWFNLSSYIVLLHNIVLARKFRLNVPKLAIFIIFFAMQIFFLNFIHAILLFPVQRNFYFFTVQFFSPCYDVFQNVKWWIQISGLKLESEWIYIKVSILGFPGYIYS